MAPDEAVAVPSRAGSSWEAQTMTDKTIDLDGRRGMEAQKATDLRRLLAELEAHLADAPAASWEEAAEKTRYVLGLYAATLTAEDTRRRTLGRGSAGGFGASRQDGTPFVRGVLVGQ
jgi:hypothetical protein